MVSVFIQEGQKELNIHQFRKKENYNTFDYSGLKLERFKIEKKNKLNQQSLSSATAAVISSFEAFFDFISRILLPTAFVCSQRARTSLPAGAAGG